MHEVISEERRAKDVVQWPSEPSAWNETAQKAGWKAKGLNLVTKPNPGISNR